MSYDWGPEPLPEPPEITPVEQQPNISDYVDGAERVPGLPPYTVVVAQHPMSELQPAINVAYNDGPTIKEEADRAAAALFAAEADRDAPTDAEDGSILLAQELGASFLPDPGDIQEALGEMFRVYETRPEETPKIDEQLFEQAYGDRAIEPDPRALFIGAEERTERLSIAEGKLQIARRDHELAQQALASLDRQVEDAAGIRKEIKRLSHKIIWAATIVGALVVGGLAYEGWVAVAHGDTAIGQAEHQTPEQIQYTNDGNAAGEDLVGLTAGSVTGITILLTGLHKDGEIARWRAGIIVDRQRRKLHAPKS